MVSKIYDKNLRFSDIRFISCQDKPNLSLLVQHLEAEGRLELDAALTIMIRGRELTAREPNLIEIGTPVTIVGDIHGQFFDMVL